MPVDVQLIGDWAPRELPRLPQMDMMVRCRTVQTALGLWDTDLGHRGHWLPKRVLHQLDMAVQECSEAWDLVEGGWKHHKRKPKSHPKAEVAAELVDVAHFLFNAYLYSGGDPEPVWLANAINRSRTVPLKYPSVDLDAAWGMAARGYAKNAEVMSALWSHGEGSHGEDWERQVAEAVNYLREKVAVTVATVREGAAVSGGLNQVPPAPGLVYLDTVVPLYRACQALGLDQAGFYSAFVHKNEINLGRIRDGY